MLGYSSVAISEARQRAKELAHERDRADMLHQALEVIARKRIMDERSAIQMRALAAAALAMETAW